MVKMNKFLQFQTMRKSKLPIFERKQSLNTVLYRTLTFILENIFFQISVQVFP